MTRLPLLFALILAACGSPGPAHLRIAPPDRPTPAASASATDPDPRDGSAPSPAPARPTPHTPLRHLETTLAGIAVEAVVFDDRSHRLVVADQADGPGSRWTDARAAGRAHNGLAAINGGFFTPEGNPLGLVIHASRSTGSVNHASSLGSGFYVETTASPGLIRREDFAGGREALQAGPFLIREGRIVPGLSPKSSSARSFIATDGHHGWILARTGTCSLADLSRRLGGRSLGGIEIRAALNLDGGRSSEIWVSSAVPGGPAFARPWWNKPVRNFLVLEPRHGSD